jgi:hypothetical protein
MCVLKFYVKETVFPPVRDNGNLTANYNTPWRETGDLAGYSTATVRCTYVGVVNSKFN